ncbi:MAG: hypothetical protein NVS3B3_05990 [Aquirhabdus sp.]
MSKLISMPIEMYEAEKEEIKKEYHLTGFWEAVSLLHDVLVNTSPPEISVGVKVSEKNRGMIETLVKVLRNNSK